MSQGSTDVGRTTRQISAAQTRQRYFFSRSSLSCFWLLVLFAGWLDIYRRYISLIYIRCIVDIFIRKYWIFSIFLTYTIFMELKKLFNVTHCDCFNVNSPCVLLAMTCAVSIFSVLEDFCQIAALHKTNNRRKRREIMT